MNDLQFEHLLSSSLNDEKNLLGESFSFESIFLSSIIPDSTNARFMPAIFIEDNDAKLFVSRLITKRHLIEKYQAENHALVGHSCIINCFNNGSNEWKQANQTIESIIELGNNISVSELIQTPTIYPVDNKKYQILTGHRRFFALVYANGYGSAAQFKLYKSKPLLSKVKQFQENASREDLPQYGKLIAFENAMIEISTLNTARLKLGMKKLTIKETANTLGISMGAYDNFNVLTRYSCIISAYESGLSISFIKIKKMILTVEAEYKAEHEKAILNITDKNKISEELKVRLSGKKTINQIPNKIKFRGITSTNTVKTLLTKNMTDLETGIDWEDIDWEDRNAVSNILSKVIEFLESKVE